LKSFNYQNSLWRRMAARSRAKDKKTGRAFWLNRPYSTRQNAVLSVTGGLQ